MAKKQKTVSEKIKHPGRLTALANRHHLTVDQEAERDKDKPGGLGQAARYYLNVLKKAKHR